MSAQCSQYNNFIMSWASMVNEATFREILLPSSGDRRSISRNMALLNILAHDVIKNCWQRTCVEETLASWRSILKKKIDILDCMPQQTWHKITLNLLPNFKKVHTIFIKTSTRCAMIICQLVFLWPCLELKIRIYANHYK